MESTWLLQMARMPHPFSPWAALLETSRLFHLTLGLHAFLPEPPLGPLEAGSRSHFPVGVVGMPASVLKPCV